MTPRGRCEGAPARFSTERIEHKSAADGQISASPVPSGRRKCAIMRTIFEFPAENPKITDLLARLAGICSLSVVPVFLLRSPRAGAPFFVQHLTCSVIHPFVDCTPLKTPVGADLEGRNFTVASQSIDRR